LPARLTVSDHDLAATAQQRAVGRLAQAHDVAGELRLTLERVLAAHGEHEVLKLPVERLVVLQMR
jgi:hypothetical protein